VPAITVEFHTKLPKIVLLSFSIICKSSASEELSPQHPTGSLLLDPTDQGTSVLSPPPTNPVPNPGSSDVKCDHLSGKSGDVREFDRCLGNVRKMLWTVSGKNCLLLTLRFGLHQYLIDCRGPYVASVEEFTAY